MILPLLNVFCWSDQFQPCRMNTDIAFGRSHGLKTLLVLTGISKREDLSAGAPQEHLPDYFAESVGSMLKCRS